MEKKKLLVPYDFSEVSNSALTHALVTASVLDAEVHVLHVVAKKEEIKDVKDKLNTAIDNIRNGSSASQVKTVNHLRVGNIFDDIAEFSAEIGTELIFMGTHGASGWQYITGSHALKIVTSSPTPFIIVQENKIKSSGYDDIVVPLDLNKETKQKLTLVANMAKYFNSRVHVVIPDQTDEFLKHTVKANIIFAKKFFAERKIDVTTTIAASGSFDKEVVKQAVKVDADLIAIMNLQKNAILGFLGNNHEQYMITNEAQIPILIVNPIEATNSYQVIFT